MRKEKNKTKWKLNLNSYQREKLCVFYVKTLKCYFLLCLFCFRLVVKLHTNV